MRTINPKTRQVRRALADIVIAVTAIVVLSIVFAGVGCEYWGAP